MTWRPEDEVVQIGPFGRAMYYSPEGAPIPFRQWGEMHQQYEYKVVALSHVGPDVTVSTVWLGMDHNWRPDGPPLIFETMIFGGPLDQEMDRYATKEEALSGHTAMVKRAQEATEPGDG